jgi:hypothetical protein
VAMCFFFCGTSRRIETYALDYYSNTRLKPPTVPTTHISAALPLWASLQQVRVASQLHATGRGPLLTAIRSRSNVLD